MAQVAWRYEPERFVSRDLDRLLALWRSIPEQATEWPEWDDYSRSDFRIEWPIERERLCRVREAANADMLVNDQRDKYEELLRLIEEHRATVEWMLDGPI